MIQIQTFGGFRIDSVDSDLTTSLPQRKSQALLSYLASAGGQPVERATLIELFWPEFPEGAARNNLSRTLSRINKAFPPGTLLADRQTVRLDRSDTCQIDLHRFNELIALARREEKDTVRSAEYLEEAVGLYRGEFLSGLALEDCQSFENWLLLQREELMLKAREASQRLADLALQRRDYENARRHARRQLALDNWHEVAHRQLMRACVGLGLRNDALAHYETCQETLIRELGTEPEMATRRLYEQILAGEAIEGILPEQPDRPDSVVKLPNQLQPLFGRRREIDLLVADLADPTRRLITIVGTGGVGKTSLALEAARMAAVNFRDGAFFISLAEIEPEGPDLSEQLATSIGAGVGVLLTGMVSVRNQVENYLADREALLVLDNFEHLLARDEAVEGLRGPPYLVHLLEQAPGLKILCTSRVPFGLPAEIILALEGLDFPEQADVPDPEQFSGVRLFVEQARRIDRDFYLEAEQLGDVLEICRLVDGLPLGIELAARWITDLTPAEIAAEIRTSLDFLTAASPQRNLRHQSVRATFSYSWRMLTHEEQVALADLSILAGDFSRKAALNISECSIGVLVRLRSKSLLHQVAPGTYSMHQLLRQFASEHLETYSTEHLSSLKRRYCTHFLKLIAAQAAGFDRNWTGAALKTITVNLENIRRAWRLALEHGFDDLVQTAVQPLFHYYRLRGLLHEARRVYSHALEHYRHRFLLEEDDRALQELLGRVMLRLGRISWLLADTHRAEQLITDSLGHMQAAGSTIDLPIAYVYLSTVSTRAENKEVARRQLDRAMALYRTSGDAAGLATALQLKATQLDADGAYEASDRVFEESITLSRESGNRRLEGRGQHDWAVTLLRRGEFERAGGLLNASLEAAQELELVLPVAFNKIMLARLARHAGRLEDARQSLLESLGVLERSGLASYTIQALNSLGEVLALLGRNQEALENLLKSRAILTAMKPPYPANYAFLILDFLAAAAFFLHAAGCEEDSQYYARLILSHTGMQTNIGRRVQALLGTEDIPHAEIAATEDALRELARQVPISD